ncbi:hypothetical protein NG791_16655 [Laspinema sp. D1]|uniref:hypothetical protein n=1 Tax=Laspinema palackyanum TaxID=3231601 RepID=UPI003479898C|nr:hypothetical protein [Laspinema sp. D2b]
MYTLRRLDRLIGNESANLTPVGSEKNGQAKRSRSSSDMGERVSRWNLCGMSTQNSMATGFTGSFSPGGLELLRSLCASFTLER